MPTKIPSCRHVLPQQSVKNPAKSRRKLHLGLTPNQHSTYKRVKRAILSCNGVCDWEKARLAAECGVSESQYTRDMRAVYRVGLVIKIERKESARRNLTNLLMLPASAPSFMGVTNGGEKLILLETSTSTPTREMPRAEVIKPPVEPKPSPVRQQWEARRAQDLHDHHRSRERYEARGQGQQRAREGFHAYKLAQAERRNYWAMRACEGMPKGPYEPATDAERLELAQRRAEDEAEALAKAAEASAQRERAAEARRIELEWLEAHREGCEDCRGTGKIPTFPGGVLTYRECKHGGMMRA
jgi:hypothetical protein